MPTKIDKKRPEIEDILDLVDLYTEALFEKLRKQKEADKLRAAASDKDEKKQKKQV